jgi:hypothetical protein
VLGYSVPSQLKNSRRFTQMNADLEAMPKTTITQFGNYPITNESMTR